jgi:putative ABC transport system substrate-binding protein
MRLTRLTALATLALALAAPLSVEAQQLVTKVYRIAYLAAGSPLSTLTGPEPSHSGFRAFVQDLRKFGYVEGQNLVIERRSAEGRSERLPDLAAELVRLNLDVIVASSGAMTLAVKKATTTIPIVMAPGPGPDVLTTGLVTSLARPGGNLTGLTLRVDYSIDGKRLELLKEVLPRAARVGVIYRTPFLGRPIATEFKDLIAAAEALRVALVFAKVDQADQFPDAFATLTRARVDSLFVDSNEPNFANRRLIADLAAQHRLATIHAQRESVEAGGLMAYGANVTDVIRRAAGYVDKILKGANPGACPSSSPRSSTWSSISKLPRRSASRSRRQCSRGRMRSSSSRRSDSTGGEANEPTGTVATWRQRSRGIRDSACPRYLRAMGTPACGSSGASSGRARTRCGMWNGSRTTPSRPTSGTERSCRWP